MFASVHTDRQRQTQRSTDTESDRHRHRISCDTEFDMRFDMRDTEFDMRGSDGELRHRISCDLTCDASGLRQVLLLTRVHLTF